jgi:hypothetical protein
MFRVPEGIRKNLVKDGCEVNCPTVCGPAKSGSFSSHVAFANIRPIPPIHAITANLPSAPRDPRRRRCV